MYIIETHAHLYDEQFDEDRALMIQRAVDAGVNQFWLPNCDVETLGRLCNLADAYPGQCLPMIGLHPTYVKENFREELDRLRAELPSRNWLAIGEIGLDFYWDMTFVEQQKEAFLIQLGWARELRLPIAIHCRNSFWETVELIEQHNDPDLRGIFHCFSGGVEEARKAVELNFLLGIGGVATFKNGGLDKVLPHVGLEHLVLETDAPYLAPVPYRGKRNEPAYLPLVAQRVADLKETSVAEVIRLTTANALALLSSTNTIHS
ncbi:TatD family hydrolase [Siphonobacter aquaeclarae]|uniref:TatD DNase family protein n=1 Tax=Siphonobacter aquaeclarae TaxID=563176 RepID=A0A1G9YMR9_9BACT|nr:TatD family hydrolase [Siphonobacter aquaeclarae]SDN09811.1 TatD DNase family protein [Siphonobacter aquaeclarae]